MTGRLLTARVVAEQLDVSPATVLRWTRQGDLPAIRLPSGQIRYRQDTFETWLRGRSTPAGAAVPTTATTDADLPATLVVSAVPTTATEQE